MDTFESRLASGQLSFAPLEEVLGQTEIDLTDLFSWLEIEERLATSHGYSALRVTMEMGWVLGHSDTWLQTIRQGGAILLMAVVVSLSVNQLRPGGLPLVADWSPEAQLTLDSGDSLMIPLDEAEMMFFARSALFLDARLGDHFAEGHIEGALNLHWDEFEQRFDQVMADIPRETPLVTYCDGESCGLSKELAMALLAKGYTDVRVLVNGWTLWQEKNLPVETSGDQLY